MVGLRQREGRGWSGRSGGHVEGSVGGQCVGGPREGVRGRTGLHRLRPGAKKGWGLKGAVLEGFRETLRGHRDGGDAAQRLLPRFHSALPSARGGRQPSSRGRGFLEPETRLAVSGMEGGRA